MRLLSNQASVPYMPAGCVIAKIVIKKASFPLQKS